MLNAERMLFVRCRCGISHNPAESITAAAGGEGEVRAVFRRSFYLGFPGERYACVGDTSLGCGPLNALVPDFRMPSLGERVALDLAGARLWTPAQVAHPAEPNVRAL